MWEELEMPRSPWSPPPRPDTGAARSLLVEARNRLEPTQCRPHPLCWVVFNFVLEITALEHMDVKSDI